MGVDRTFSRLLVCTLLLVMFFHFLQDHPTEEPGHTCTESLRSEQTSVMSSYLK